MHPLINIFLALTLLIIMLRTQPSSKLNYSPLSMLNWTFFIRQSIFVPYLLKKSMSIILSKSDMFIIIRSITISQPPRETISLISMWQLWILSPSDIFILIYWTVKGSSLSFSTIPLAMKQCVKPLGECKGYFSHFFIIRCYM